MKKERIIEIIILFFLFTAAIVGAAVFNHYKNEKPNTYNIVFKDIDSIVKGSPVRFMGMNVGYVVKLKRKDKYIICKIRITKDGVKIPDLTRAKVAFNGLGGSKSIELLPPLTNEGDIRGIVAAESLRINDLAGMVKDLVDVTVIINDFVQAIDPDLISRGIKEITNPEIINRVDKDMEKMVKRQKEIDGEIKSATKRENSFSEFIEFLNNQIKSFLKAK